MHRRTVMASTLAALFVTGAAWAQDKTLAIVVKGLDNPFFGQINKGCQKWNSENAGSGYTCYYTGPASSADEVGEVQIVQDLLQRPDVAAIAISPSNAPLMARMPREQVPKIPIMTIDADLAAEDADRVASLRRHAVRFADLSRHRALLHG